MNVSELPRLCVMNQSFVIYLCLYLKLFSSCAAVFISESLLVIGFSPHIDTTAVFGIAHDHT